MVGSFRDEGMSNYMVVYLRLIASCQLQTDSEFYQNFISSGKTIVEFCKTVGILSMRHFFEETKTDLAVGERNGGAKYLPSESLQHIEA